MHTALLHSLWHYRGFVLGSVQREFQTRYRNSLLGALWTIINPLAMIIVYTVIFSRLMQARLPGVDNDLAYGIYLCAGLLTWGLFAEIIGRSQSVFLEHATLLKKLSFPRICLPLVVVLNALLNFAIIFCLFLGFLLVTGNFPGWVVIAILPVLLIQIVFAVGLGIILGVLNVFFRDVGQMTGIVLQFWFWFTPIIYPPSILPESAAALLKWNPMVPLIQSYQGIFVQGAWPQWSALWPMTLISVLLCLFALSLFRKRSGEMVDEL
ncbi:ABC transporter [Pseudomonas sp. G11-1]|uniref:Transport permease protein n=1 Tax=Halopseudomonas bauzanensis TaxID=653930 RepID=A0A4U0YJQ8_9GAMM|nr:MULTISPECIES: ABC transporter permease [Halopseudomonas]MCO5786555.1 ABC transporter [Pseudomonas sp. G11-1]MCO5789781.1 ABC transporter [Pseudomonas sp. G11-2]TKA92300.1 ABC transporter permease [Halopseudomonas bauzanensis]WGK62548.1 ABC transporter permease [Halopseudomonas sp. SMJS2]